MEIYVYILSLYVHNCIYIHKMEANGVADCSWTNLSGSTRFWKMTMVKYICLQFGIDLDRSGPTPAQHDHLGSAQLGPKFGPAGPLWGQPGAKLGISNVFWLWWCSYEATLPTFGLSWAQLRRQMSPHRTNLRMLSGTCVQTCPSCAMLDPRWAGSCSAQLKAKDGQVWPQSAFG
jgi:hypothetical protein